MFVFPETESLPAEGKVMKSAMYVGQIAHERHIPKKHRFKYPLFMWFLHLDCLDELPELGPWFATRGMAFSRLCRSDYLGDSRVPLADAVRVRMREITGEAVSGEVYGLMHMRTMGLYFSPVNFYYGYGADGQFTHFLAEVSNTPWNERHQYAYHVADGRYDLVQSKAFQVSPFNPLRQQYRWLIEPPGATVGVAIKVNDSRGEIFEARLKLERQPLNLPVVRRLLMKRPVMTAFIVAGIYYQALKIYLKGIPYIPYGKEAL